MASKPTIEPPPTFKSFAVELAIYAVLVTVYFLLAFHYLGAWFKELYDTDRRLFAIMALVVMIGQTVGLELVCTSLIWIMRGKKKKK